MENREKRGTQLVSPTEVFRLTASTLTLLRGE